MARRIASHHIYTKTSHRSPVHAALHTSLAHYARYAFFRFHLRDCVGGEGENKHFIYRFLGRSVGWSVMVLIFSYALRFRFRFQFSVLVLVVLAATIGQRIDYFDFWLLRLLVYFALGFCSRMIQCVIMYTSCVLHNTYGS